MSDLRQMPRTTTESLMKQLCSSSQLTEIEVSYECLLLK